MITHFRIINLYGSIFEKLVNEYFYTIIIICYDGGNYFIWVISIIKSIKYNLVLRFPNQII